MGVCLAHHYLTRTALQESEAIAVTDGHDVLSYKELALASDRLAYLLVSLGVGSGDRVAYVLNRSPNCVVATFGILKAGAAYVPLDQKCPQERWLRIIADAAPKAVLCDGTTLAETMKRAALLEAALPLVYLGAAGGNAFSERKLFLLEEAKAAAGTDKLPEAGQDDVAYVLYTSGSTGTPKGVMVTHANIRNYIDWATSHFQITTRDRILGTAPFHFDMSTFDLFCPAAVGGTLVLAGEKLLLFPENLVRLIEREKVTLWKGVSSLLMYMCRAGVVRQGRMPSLRTVIFAGETLNPKYLAAWMEAFPEKSFFNAYGPTEATGISLCHRVRNLPESDQPVPIGRPCKGAEVVLLGEDSLPVRSGQTGELCIAGPCLAKGYLNDQELTKKNFTAPPPGCVLSNRIYWTGDLVRQTADGDYVFVSRKDHQVKWMGYRIDLAEIESNLQAHPQVRDAVTLLVPTGNGDLTELAAFYEAEGQVDSAALNRFLRERLPAYMIPKRYLKVEALPRNDRGKLARADILQRYLGRNSGNGDGGAR